MGRNIVRVLLAAAVAAGGAGDLSGVAAAASGPTSTGADSLAYIEQQGLEVGVVTVGDPLNAVEEIDKCA
jgi:hypothetical protein